jgi:hypothetical protein
VLAGLGLLALATALRPDRRPVAVAGGLLLSASSWVRLADAGITAPEPYVLPLAAAALVLGALRRRAEPTTRSWAAYGPGLLLALVPSLLAGLDGDDLTRPLLVGLAALAVLLAGARSRLQAPLAVGAGVLVVVALDLLGPYAAASPAGCRSAAPAHCSWWSARPTSSGDATSPAARGFDALGLTTRWPSGAARPSVAPRAPHLRTAGRRRRPATADRRAARLSLRGVVKAFGEPAGRRRARPRRPRRHLPRAARPERRRQVDDDEAAHRQAVADEGTIEVLGLEVPRQSKQARAQMGVVPQQDNLDIELTVRQNLQVFARLYRVPRGRPGAAVERALEVAQLTARARDARRRPVRRHAAPAAHRPRAGAPAAAGAARRADRRARPAGAAGAGASSTRCAPRA